MNKVSPIAQVLLWALYWLGEDYLYLEQDQETVGRGFDLADQISPLKWYGTPIASYIRENGHGKISKLEVCRVTTTRSRKPCLIEYPNNALRDIDPDFERVLQDSWNVTSNALTMAWRLSSTMKSRRTRRRIYSVVVSCPIPDSGWSRSPGPGGCALNRQSFL